MLTFKKWQAASQSYGRGMDNVRSAAKWAVHKDGKHIATIMPAGAMKMYGGTPAYKVIHPTTYRELKYVYKGGLKAAKEWVMNNHDKLV